MNLIDVGIIIILISFVIGICGLATFSYEDKRKQLLTYIVPVSIILYFIGMILVTISFYTF